MNLFGFGRPAASGSAASGSAASDSASTSLQTIDASTLKQWLDQQSAIVVDVRETDEYQAGHIPGATLLPLSSFDPAQLPQAESPAQKVVLYCRSGKRSTTAAQKLLAAGHSEVIHLGGGIGSWVAAGYPVQA